MGIVYGHQTDWAEEQTARTETFQREIQSKSDELSDLKAEKVAKVQMTCRRARRFLSYEMIHY